MMTSSGRRVNTYDNEPEISLDQISRLPAECFSPPTNDDYLVIPKMAFISGNPYSLMEPPVAIGLLRLISMSSTSGHPGLSTECSAKQLGLLSGIGELWDQRVSLESETNGELIMSTFLKHAGRLYHPWTLPQLGRYLRTDSREGYKHRRPRNKNRTSIPQKVRFSVFKRDMFRCVYCGATSQQQPLEIDHVKPVSHGGKHHIDNYVTACWECNIGKSDSSIVEENHA